MDSTFTLIGRGPEENHNSIMLGKKIYVDSEDMLNCQET